MLSHSPRRGALRFVAPVAAPGLPPGVTPVAAVAARQTRVRSARIPMPELLVPWDGAAPRRDAPLPVASPDSPDHWLDLDFARAFSESMVRPWADGWFRASVEGAEHLPAARGAILAMNHSGMGWPWDAVVFMHRLGARHDYARAGVARGFALPFFFTLPGLGPLIRRTGMWPARFDELFRLLGQGELVLYFPEGVEGIGKGWRRRYRTQPFHTSFVRACVRYRAPVLPCACLGAEAMNPLATNLPRVARASGLPIFPLSPLQLALFPTWLTSMFFALPTRLRYVIGAPLMFRLDEATATDADYRAAAEELRRVIQGMIDEHLHAPAPPVREPLPASGPGPFVYPWTASDQALAALPWGWPLLYLRFWNAYQAAVPPSGRVGAATYAPHAIDTLDEAALLVPWGWLLPLVRHRRELLG